MASVTTRPNGHRWIQFRTSVGGKRHTIRLGAVPSKTALEFKHKLERLISARAMGAAPDLATSQWVATIDPRIQRQLAACGLVQQCKTVVTLGQLLDEYDKTQESARPSTKVNVKQMRRSLVDYFGAECPIVSITAAGARQFRAHLLAIGSSTATGLSRATVSRRLRRARSVFKLAVDSGWLQHSPFAEMRGFSEVNRENDFFVTVELANQVLAEMPDAENRAAFVLARWGGLRFPSEVLPITWDSVLWDKNLLHVKSPKTEHHDNGQERFTPLFPEVRQVLEILWDVAEEGEKYILPGRQCRTRTATTNALERACRAAGVVMWPRPWDNMRASRVTELIAEHPIQDVADWMGHNSETLLKHYAQIAKERRASVVSEKSVLRLPEVAPRAKQNAKQS